MYRDKAGRHYWFAEKLIDRGYDVTVFCSTTLVSGENLCDVNKGLYIIKRAEKTPFVFVKTNSAQGNGFARIKNWFLFYKRLFPVTRVYAKEKGKPDVIIASSVHPLTMIAGIKIAKKYKVPCICEIRDLWPETIFQFGKAKEDSLLGKVLIKGEHWIYKKADALVFTKEGDTDYLKERRWTTAQGGDIALEKCHYINNGIDIKVHDERMRLNTFEDPDLSDERYFNVTYAGAIKPINNVGNILDAAGIIKEKGGYDDIRFLIYGEGTQLEYLQERVEKERLNNVKMKGYVNRQYIPYILSRSSVNILNYSQEHYNWTRGNSSNKLFEYMASGKPIISTVHMGYSIVKEYNCGIELDKDTPEDLAEAIIRIHDMRSEECMQIGKNARAGANNFDFNILTEKLVNVIESVD